MPIHPCGTVMDWIRTGYRTKMRLWADRPDEVEVRWFRAPDGAGVFPSAHAFTSRDWFPAIYKDEPTAIGEQPGPREWDNGANLVGYVGTNFCGSLDAYLVGGRTGIDPEIATGPDGDSPCCAAAAETDAEQLLVQDEDIDASVDSDRLFAGGEDDEMAQIPQRFGPFPTKTTDEHFNSLAGFVIENITAVNVTNTARWFSYTLDSTLLGTSTAVFWQTVVQPFSTLVYCCKIASGNEEHHYQGEVDDAITLMISGYRNL